MFQFLDAPAILNVTLDPFDTFTPTAVSFTTDTISLNLSGNTVTSDGLAVLDIQLASQTPEPSTWLLILTSYVVLGFVLRKSLFAAA